MPKANNAIPHVHQRKHFQPSCAHKGTFRVHLDQATKRIARRRKRLEKARRIFPRPLRTLKPQVNCPTIRYNFKKRLGRGFSTEELKAAGVKPHFAATVGISVDGRRKNISEEGLKANVQRLQDYMSKLVLFPINHKKVRAGEASAEEVKAVKAAKQNLDRRGPAPNPAGKKVVAVLPVQKLTAEEKKKQQYKFLKNAISAERFFGARLRLAQRRAEAKQKKN